MNTHTDTGRRGFLRSACKHCVGLSALLGLPAMAQDLTGGTVAFPPRFTRPLSYTY